MILEPIRRPVVGISNFFRDIGTVYAANAIVAILFSCTGPVAIIVSVGLAGGLSQAEIASWIFAGSFVGGVLTILFSIAYKQPLSFAWTIPGSVLLGSSLDHLSFAEVIGAFWVTGVLVGAIGLSGGVRKALKYTPMPIVLAMVAGIFLQFGLDLVLAFENELLLAAVMVIAYFAVLTIPQLTAVCPPVVAALAGGVVVVLATGNFEGEQVIRWFDWPVVHTPEFSQQALFELVIPLAVTVLVAQNAQGFAVLTASGHAPPVNSMTTACGAGSLVNAVFGSVSACVTGPANAVLVSGGEPARQYTAGVLFGMMSIAFGLMAFGATWLILKLPTEFIAVLSGLALLPVLLKSFVTAFSGRFQMGALVALIVTISDITIWNIGAPFWGLMAGLAVGLTIERNDYREHLKEARS
ncbi:MAG: benzoate/H(+) symporter BenE family transporter [Acidiferrobacterales bacterium]|nr:benzoate/H(+) symporter BenE family transporter [Acidiferrobacterales bacterium]